MTSFTLQSILIFLLLLSGFYSFKAVNFLTDSYIDRATTWNTPKIITYIFSQSLIIHSIFFLIFSISYFLLSCNEYEIIQELIFIFDNVFINQLIEMRSVFFCILFILIYILISTISGRIWGVYSASKALYEIQKKSSLGSNQKAHFINHKWATNLINLNSRELNPYWAYVYVKSIPEKTQACYYGKIKDFFISQSGKFEYIVIEQPEKQNSNGFEKIFKPNEDNGLGILYIQSDQILNVALRPQSDVNEIVKPSFNVLAIKLLVVSVSLIIVGLLLLYFF